MTFLTRLVRSHSLEQMLACLFAFGFCANSDLKSAVIRVSNGTNVLFLEKLEQEKQTHFSMTENNTLSVTLMTKYNKAPKSHTLVLEQGIYSIASAMQFKSGNLSLALTKIKLQKLYKHSGEYTLSVLVLDNDMTKPLIWKLGTVDFQANGEVFDNFTDVEWDFQAPKPQPKEIIIKFFTLVQFAPLGIALILLLINGCNCGYFPHNFIDAIVSILFVVSLGAFFVFYVYFWKYIHFEDMLKYLCVAFLVLGVLLRGALVGRAKMVARYAKKD